eukprot:6194315-Pleurochrysis_carterae.AAC.1
MAEGIFLWSERRAQPMFAISRFKAQRFRTATRMRAIRSMLSRSSARVEHLSMRCARECPVPWWTRATGDKCKKLILGIAVHSSGRCKRA